MKSFNLLIVIFTIGLLFSSVDAAEWQLLYESKTLGEFFYLDVDSISSEGVIVTSWQKELYKYKDYVLSKSSINCKTIKIRIEEFANYNPDGTLKESFSIPLNVAEWKEVAPDEMAFEIIKSVCKNGKPRPVDEIRSGKI